MGAMSSLRLRDDIVVKCPHCGGVVVVAPKDIRCAIFRHGIFKRTGEPVPPHSTKVDCERFVERDEIWGCGGPFRLVKEGKVWCAVVCDYI